MGWCAVKINQSLSFFLSLIYKKINLLQILFMDDAVCMYFCIFFLKETLYILNLYLNRNVIRHYYQTLWQEIFFKKQAGYTTKKKFKIILHWRYLNHFHYRRLYTLASALGIGKKFFFLFGKEIFSIKNWNLRQAIQKAHWAAINNKITYTWILFILKTPQQSFSKWSIGVNKRKHGINILNSYKVEVMKGYSTLSTSPELEPHHQMQLNNYNSIQNSTFYPLYKNLSIGLVGRVFANGLGDWDSIPSWVIPKTQKNGTWYHFT